MTTIKNIKFGLMIDQTLSGIILINKDREIQYYNKTAFDLLECCDSSLTNKRFDDFLHPDYHDICKERIHHILTEKLIAEPMEQKLVTTEGRMVDVEIKGVPYIDSEDIQALLYIRDITKQKQAERLLAHKDKLSSIGQVAAGIAHEVRNPLAAVKGFIQLLKEEMEHPYIEPIENELKKALSTLNNLLHVSKPDQLNESNIAFNLVEELDAIIFLFQEKTYHITIIKDYKKQKITINGKKNLLVKSFFNLLKNAIEAIENHGKITIELDIVDYFASIKITDTGIGIPKDKIRMLGTPFFSTKSYGTGMGLTQVFTTVNDHKGQIHIESKIDVGTSIHILLPLMQKPLVHG